MSVDTVVAIIEQIGFHARSGTPHVGVKWFVPSESEWARIQGMAGEVAQMSLPEQERVMDLLRGASIVTEATFHSSGIDSTQERINAEIDGMPG